MKNKSHKRVKFTRINPLSVGIAIIIGLIWCCTPGKYDDTYTAEQISELIESQFGAKEFNELLRK